MGTLKDIDFIKIQIDDQPDSDGHVSCNVVLYVSPSSKKKIKLLYGISIDSSHSVDLYFDSFNDIAKIITDIPTSFWNDSENDTAISPVSYYISNIEPNIPDSNLTLTSLMPLEFEKLLEIAASNKTSNQLVMEYHKRRLQLMIDYLDTIDIGE